MDPYQLTVQVRDYGEDGCAVTARWPHSDQLGELLDVLSLEEIWQMERGRAGITARIYFALLDAQRSARGVNLFGVDPDHVVADPEPALLNTNITAFGVNGCRRGEGWDTGSPPTVEVDIYRDDDEDRRPSDARVKEVEVAVKRVVKRVLEL